MNNYVSPIAIHPGEHLKELIEALEITHTEFSERLGISEKSLDEIVNAKVGISIEIAAKLSKMFGNSTAYWVNLQTNYEESILRVNVRCC